MQSLHAEQGRLTSSMKPSAPCSENSHKTVLPAELCHNSRTHQCPSSCCKPHAVSQNTSFKSGPSHDHFAALSSAATCPCAPLVTAIPEGKSCPSATSKTIPVTKITGRQPGLTPLSIIDQTSQCPRSPSVAISNVGGRRGQLASISLPLGPFDAKPCLPCDLWLDRQSWKNIQRMQPRLEARADVGGFRCDNRYHGAFGLSRT